MKKLTIDTQKRLVNQKLTGIGADSQGKSIFDETLEKIDTISNTLKTT